MKKTILDFINEKGLKIPTPYNQTESAEDPICYIRFNMPEWDFFIFEIDENGDFANALVYSPFTSGIADHGLIPLKNFAEKYSAAFSYEYDFSLVKLDRNFKPTPLSEILKQKW